MHFTKKFIAGVDIFGYIYWGRQNDLSREKRNSSNCTVQQVYSIVNTGKIEEK